MKTKIITAAVVAVVLATLAWRYVYAMQEKVQSLESQTISGQITQVQKEARELEKKKQEYEKLGVDSRLEILYNKSNTLKTLSST